MIKKLKIDSKLFLEIFKISLEEVTKGQNDLLEQYKGNNNVKGEPHSWTNVMERTYCKMEEKFQVQYKGNSKKTLNLYCNNYNIIKKNQLNRSEHLHIDATFFDETEHLDDNLRKKLGLSKKNNKIWNLLLAVEHENDYSSSFHEVRQLLQINCPLRVSISYLKPTNNEEVFKKYIDFYLELFKKQEEVSEMCIDDEFLLIFGNSAENAEKIGKIVYRCICIKKESEGIKIISDLSDIEISIS